MIELDQVILDDLWRRNNNKNTSVSIYQNEITGQNTFCTQASHLQTCLPSPPCTDAVKVELEFCFPQRSPAAKHCSHNPTGTGIAIACYPSLEAG